MKSNYIFGYPAIDLHTHLRNDINKHTQIAKECGIDIVVYMANSIPSLDNLSAIKKSLKQKRNCLALPVSAITKNLEGKELVDIDKIKPFVAGFSDDGKYLANLNLLKQALEKDILIMAHCCPQYEIAVKNPELETEYIEKYIDVFSKVKKGKLHIQHVSKKDSVDIIRKAKNRGLKMTCETCPHYFTYTRGELDVKVNPPLGLEEDVLAIRQGLADGTIDVIASDYAPEPRITGIAGFRSFLPLCYGLALDKTISRQQLKEKIYLNPKKIVGIRYRQQKNMEVMDFRKILFVIAKAAQKGETAEIYYPKTQRRGAGWREIEPYSLATDVAPEGEHLVKNLLPATTGK